MSVQANGLAVPHLPRLARALVRDLRSEGDGMSATFTKLDSGLTESTLWSEPDRTRLVWITMLARCDQFGRVLASIPGLAHIARVPIKDTEAALDAFLSPDPYSRTKEFEGRRIEAIDGGWRLLNHGKYRAIRAEDDRREQNRLAQARARARRRAAKASAPLLTPADASPESATSAHTDADADADAEKKEKEKARARPHWHDHFIEVDRQVLDDWHSVRLAKKAGKVTDTVAKSIRREASKAGLSVQDAIAFCCEAAWQGFRADWYAERQAGKGSTANIFEGAR